MKYPTSAIAIILAASATAQWTVMYLNPPATTASYAFGVHGGKQVGSARVASGISHAGVWSGTAGSFVNLHPAGFLTSVAAAVSGGQQAGFAEVGGIEQAGVWTGSAASWLSLHPAGATRSVALDVEAGQQVGIATFAGAQRASLWSGTAASRVDLHPVGATQSALLGMGDGQQVGWTQVSGVIRASLWTGTPGSVVDLHPAGATESLARDCQDGQQVGYGQWVGGGYHASLWTGTASSWISLHPAMATESAALGVDDGLQVGWANVDFPRASLWHGTPGSWVDLHVFLQNFAESSAHGIVREGHLTYVVGNGFNELNQRWEAVMWVAQSVMPTSYSMFRGSVFSGNLASLQNSDNDRLVMRPGITLGTSQPPIQIILEGTATSSSPNGFSFSLESSASFGNAQQKISLHNFTTGLYEELDARLAKTTDDTVTVTVRTNPSRFIEPGTLAISALVSFRAVGPSLAFPWSGRIDKVWWSFPG